MTDPRWTPEERENGKAFRLAFNKRPIVVGAPWCDDLIIRHFEDVPQHTRLSPPAFDALVAAVHDADTLHQARQLRDLLMPVAVDHLDGKWVSHYVALLDLLAPPAPDTGEGTSDA